MSFRGLKNVEPLRRQAVLTVERAQDVAGNRRGGVTVPAVVHGDGDCRAEVGLRVPGSRRRVRCRGEYRIERDGECLLGHPSLAEFPDQFLGVQQCAGGAQPEGGLEPGDKIGVGLFTLAQVPCVEFSEREFRRFAQSAAVGQGMDDEAEDAGTLPRRGMPVGQRGRVGAELVDGFGGDVGDQAEGGRTHDGAAALGVRIDRAVEGSHLSGGQAAQAGVSRSAAVLEDVVGIDPAGRLERCRVRNRHALGSEPAQVREPQARVGVRGHARVGPLQRLQQPVNGVERELRVVGKVAAAVER